jgi:hypothetical protein
MANGNCKRSGGTKTSGINAAYQITIPIKSLVRMWELSAKKFFMCANPEIHISIRYYGTASMFFFFLIGFIPGLLPQ